MQYTYSGNPNTENLLRISLNGIAEEIAALPESIYIRSVVLGGGYGRGEGGATPEGFLYNDLDFLVFSRTPEVPAMIVEPFGELSRKWKKQLGIDVDFFMVPDDKWLARNAETLMIQEMIAGHAVIFGEPGIFRETPRIPWEKLPWSEGARLLLNRGTGLLLARRKADDAEFGIRNLHKAALGCGDALLIARHAYKRTGMERLSALSGLPDIPGPLADLYERALQYKYTPDPAKQPEPMEQLPAYCELWQETLRRFTAIVTKEEPSSAETAVRALCNNAGDPFARRLKNSLLNLRYCKDLPFLFPSGASPRLKLLLPLSELLNAPSASAETYLRLWNRFN